MSTLDSSTVEKNIGLDALFLKRRDYTLDGITVRQFSDVYRSFTTKAGDLVACGSVRFISLGEFISFVKACQTWINA